VNLMCKMHVSFETVIIVELRMFAMSVLATATTSPCHGMRSPMCGLMYIRQSWFSGRMKSQKSRA